MKKIAVVLLAATLVALPSCKNKNKEAKEETISENAEQLLAEDLKINASNLIESAKKLKVVPFMDTTPDGKVILSDKEKLVKPDYLIDPACVNDLVTLSQKYRAICMLAADMKIASLYDMPKVDYQEALQRLIVDINDEPMKTFASYDWDFIRNDPQPMSDLVEGEYAQDRAVYFWDGMAASFIEQLFIITRDIDKFMPMFTDEVASELTFNFVCLHEGLVQTVAIYPEMEGLNQVLTPLYVINAITVDQLREQLLSIKADIENARAYLLK